MHGVQVRTYIPGALSTITDKKGAMQITKQIKVLVYIRNIMFLMYIVKVVVDGPPGQKVSAQRKDKDRESGRIVGSVPPQSILSVASGYVRGIHLAQVFPLVVPLCLNVLHIYL